MKRIAIKALLLLISTVFACLVAEGLVRFYGYRPYRTQDFEITFNPTPFAVPHPRLGYMIRPGKIDVQFKNGFSWSATQDADSCRITGPDSATVNGLPKLFVYGCSVAYGYGVADSQTFPYLLQQKLPQFRVKNYAVPGFAQTQAYLQLHDAIDQKDIPEVVLLTYASFHDIRNTLCRQRRKDIYPYNKKASMEGITYPVAAYVHPNSFTIHYEPLSYREWPLMRYSALVHLLETKFDEYEMQWKKSHEVSKILVNAIHTLCRQNNIRLIVAGIQNDSGTEDMLNYCSHEGIENVDLSFDKNDLSYTLQPFDPHPSAKGHAYFAEKLRTYLSQGNSKTRARVRARLRGSRNSSYKASLASAGGESVSFVS